MKPCIGIYFVIGYGSDCDGSSSFNCRAFVNKRFAEDYRDGRNDWSDGVQFSLTSNMEIVQDYCDYWQRMIPLAYPEMDEVIESECTYVDYIEA